MRKTLLFLAMLTASTGCDNVEEVVDIITETPELELVIASRMSPVMENDQALITIVASNTGAVDAENTQMQLLLPDRIRFFTAPAGADCPGSCTNGDTMTWDLGRLAKGESRVLQFNVEPDGTAALSTFSFAATLDADGANTVNRVQTVSIAENNGTDYALIFAADANPGTVRPGGTTEIRISFVNGSASGYSGAILSLDLPSGLTLVAAGQGGMTQGATTTWDLGPLDPLDGGIRSVTVRVDDGQDPGETITLASQLTAGTNYSESLSLALPIVQQIAIDLSIAADVATAVENTPFTVTINLSNPTGTDLENTVVRLILPDAIRFFTAPAGADCPGSCTSGDTMTWAVGRLSTGQSRTLIFLVEPDNDAAGTPLPFTARADADGVSTALASLTLPTTD